jgi:hypothetical protein
MHGYTFVPVRNCEKIYMSALGKLIATLGLDHSEFSRGLNKSEKQAKESASKIDGLMGKMSGSIKAGLAGIVAGLTVGAVTNAFRNVVDQLDVFDELAAKTHLSVEALSKYQYMAGLTSTSLDQIADGHKKLGKAMGEARDGNERLTATLQRHGVTMEDIQNLDSETAFRKIADSFSEMDNGVQKTNDSMELMGKSIGPELIEFLNNGSAGFDRMAQEAAIMGAVVGTDAAVAAGKLNDEMYKLDVQASALGRSFMSQFIPTVLQVASSFNAARIAGEGFWNSFRIGISKGGVVKEIESLERKLKNNKLYGNAFGAENAELEAKIKSLKGATEALANIKAPPPISPPTPPARAARAARSPSAARPQKSEEQIQAEKDAKDLAKLLESIETPFAKYEKAVNEITRLAATGVSDSKLELMLQKEADAFQRAIESTDEYRAAQDQLREIASLYGETRSPLEKLNIELTSLNELYASGALDLDTYARAQFKLEDQLNSHVKEAKKVETAYDAMGNAVANWSDQFASALMSSDTNFSSFASSLLKQIAQIGISAAMQPLFKGFGDWVGAMSSIGNKATGGSVFANTPVTVGEMGREIFVPSSNGSIIPSNKLGSTVNQTFNIEGAPNPAQIQALISLAVKESVGAMTNIQTSNSRFARA